MAKISISPGIFREYDIRGVFGKDLTVETAKSIGRAYARYLKELGLSRVSVARDARLSSDALRDGLLDGITSISTDIVDLGVCPTPLLYFSLFHLKVDGGIMITGSHNPPEFNGFKVCVGKDTLHGREIQALKDRVVKEQREKESGIGEGEVETYEIIPAYIDYMKRQFPSLPSIKVAIDCGNGTVGLVAPRLLKELGCRVLELYCEPDGRFPNHHPDPTVIENLKDLISTVKKEGADLGIAYDGDGDRIGVIDEEGRVMWGDRLMVLFAREILKYHPGATFISEVKSSQVMYDDIEKRGGKPIMWRTGHSLIKAKMKETGALLAGEMSGHIFFADRYFGYDDAIYATCRLLELFSKARIEQGKGFTLSSLLSDLPEVYTTPEIRVDCPDEDKFRIVEKMKGTFDSYKKNGNLGIRDLITIDGVRVIFEDGWGLVRASNTQPVLVLRFEATSPKRLTEIRKLIEGELEKAKEQLIINNEQ